MNKNQSDTSFTAVVNVINAEHLSLHYFRFYIDSFLFPGLTGPIVIDYKGDRIMNYDVWYLANGGEKFQEFMVIPLSQAGRNTTSCVKWLVCIFSVK